MPHINVSALVTPGFPGRQQAVGLGRLDKLDFKTNHHVDICRLAKLASEIKRGAFRGHYREVLKFDFGLGKVITIQQGKRSRSQKFEFKVESNPGVFESWDEYLELLKIVTDLDKAEICRLDFCVDLPSDIYGLKDVANRATVKGMKSVLGGDRWFSIGKRPKRIEFYDKGRTRIEVQLSNGHCPIKRFSQIEDLAKFKPFSSFGLEFRWLRPSAFTMLRRGYRSSWSIARTRDSQKKFEQLCRRHILLHAISEFGVDRSRRMLNQQGNFDRDQDRFLTKAKGLSSKMLDGIWQRCFKEFVRLPRKKPGHKNVKLLVGDLPVSNPAL